MLHVYICLEVMCSDQVNRCCISFQCSWRISVSVACLFNTLFIVHRFPWKFKSEQTTQLVGAGESTGSPARTVGAVFLAGGLLFCFMLPFLCSLPNFLFCFLPSAAVLPVASPLCHVLHAETTNATCGRMANPALEHGPHTIHLPFTRFSICLSN